MRQLIISLLVSLMVFGLAIDNANAARFGGGRSMGSYSRSISTPHRTVERPMGTATQRPARGHFLSGLIAGGLLGALFFGGGFHGFKFLDFLILAVIVFAIIAFISRRKAAMSHQASSNQYRASTEQPSFFSTSQATSSQGKVPSWFDRDRFLADAKQHFSRIQQAWDANNLAEIQDYVTPTLYNVLKAERANQPANNKTEIVRLFADLGDIQEYGQQAEASVLFHGVLIENGVQTEFNEVWHLVRELKDQAPWYIQGIEQRN